MKVVDWKVVARELVQYVSPIEVAAGLVKSITAKHTREVPEGLATRLLRTVEMYRTETRGHGITSEFIGEDTTPEACAQLDADAEAMRVRREVEELPGFWELAWLEDGRWRIICGGEHYVGQNSQAAYDALQKAGKLL
jgi:hypothetical protein